MDPYVTSHFSHRALLLDLRNSKGGESKSTAVVLSRIAEVDARQLYLQEGYPSMYTFLVQDLNYSEGAAYKRLYAARTARKFPLLYDAVADGKLHLSAVVMLSRYLTEGNVGELVHAATHKTKAQIEQLIADRFPRRDLPERMQVIVPPPTPEAMPPAWLAELSPGKVDATASPLASPCPMPAVQLSPGTVAPSAPPSRMTPLAPQRVAFQFTGDQETRNLYEEVRALLSHQVPGGEMALVFKRALEIAKAELEQRKYAVTERPGHSRGSKSARHIPASVRRRCTFVSETGKRCNSPAKIEFHHDDEVAFGGPSTADNLRLLCRAHNQHEAERTFGAEFMNGKRAQARQRARTPAAAAAQAQRRRGAPGDGASSTPRLFTETPPAPAPSAPRRRLRA